MIYLIGGAPRVGKSILCQQFSAKLGIGWISTDLIVDLLRVKGEAGVKTTWNATQDSIRAVSEWFFPYLDRFLWGVSSMAESYAIEGVDFLPEQVKELSSRYQIQTVFLGCTQMSLETLNQFPGRSPGYAALPESIKQQITQDIPVWSEFVRQEAERFGYPFVDTSHAFPQRLEEAEEVLAMGA